MCVIRMYGPPSEKYQSFKKKISTAMTAWDDDVELIEESDIEKIIQGRALKVPSAVLEGPSEFVWTVDTSLEQMLGHLKSNSTACSETCPCRAECLARKKKSEI